jgi:hypothetical protein
LAHHATGAAQDRGETQGGEAMSEPCKICGIPEGRPGIWLIGPNVAESLILAVQGETVHNLMESGWTYLGADWEKSAAIELCRREGKRIGLVFWPNATAAHQLVVLDDERKWMFDVGEIDEGRMNGGIQP